MFRYHNHYQLISRRTFKDFGHKRQPIPGITTLWHGFLTFSFIGMCLNWNRLGKWFGLEDAINEANQEEFEPVKY